MKELNEREIKRMMDAMYLAKRIWELQPELPDGISSAEMHVLDAVEQLSAGQKAVYVSNIAAALKLPRPGVTRAVKVLTERGYFEKETDGKDRRYVAVRLSEAGQRFYEEHDRAYFAGLKEKLGGIDASDAETMIACIEKVYDALHGCAEEGKR
ncbi:MAG: MarR family winged helix-turn-helix transcriptional regulator [Stomatobaculum longum]